MTSPGKGRDLPESGDLDGTELTLGLPGNTTCALDGGQKSGTKRGFSNTVDLSLGNSANKDAGKSNSDVSGVVESPFPKARVLGWPPLRTTAKGCKYVKVAVDGAAYLRKVNLDKYNCYEALLSALEDMFSGLIIRYYVTEKNVGKSRVEYVPTYEDRDGDWMLVGDVPWKVFIESCKRLRLMKSADAIGLAPRSIVSV